MCTTGTQPHFTDEETDTKLSDSPKATPIKVQCGNTPLSNSSVCVLSTTLHRPQVWMIEKWLFLPLKWMFCWLLELFSVCWFSGFFSFSLPILVLLPIKLSQLPPRNWHISLASSKKQPGKGTIYSPCRSLTIHLKVGQAWVDASALKSRATEATWWLQGGGSVYPIHKSVSSWVHIGLAQLNQDDASTPAFMPKRNY